MTSIIAGVKIGGATGATLVLAEALTGATTINLHEALAVVVFTCGIVWWMSKKFQSLEDNQSAMKDDIAAIKKDLEER
jgi:hypothetical protein